MSKESWYASGKPEDIIRIDISDNFIVDYDKARGMYRVSVFDDGHFWDEFWFDAYEERELSSNEVVLHLYWKTFIRGAAELTEYMRKNYQNGIFPSDITDVLKGFCSQFGELKEINN